MTKGLFIPRKRRKRFSPLRTLITLGTLGLGIYSFMPSELKESVIELGKISITRPEPADGIPAADIQHDLEKKIDSCKPKTIVKETDPFNNIQKRYYIALVDSTSTVPVKLDQELYNHAKRFSRIADPSERAKAIFDWEIKNIAYGKSKRYCKTGYRDTLQTWKDRQGVCGEMAYLYTALARASGLQAELVYVKRNHRGKKVEHMCSSVDIDGTRMLVDPAYRMFDAKHHEVDRLGDAETRRKFSRWRKKRGKGCNS